MNKRIRIISLLTTVFVITVFLTAGCEEQQAENTKKSRLLAEQLEKKDAEIAKLKKALDNCEVEKVVIQKKSEKDINAVGESVVEIFTQVAELQQENDNLKKQIEELKKQLEQEN